MFMLQLLCFVFSKLFKVIRNRLINNKWLCTVVIEKCGVMRVDFLLAVRGQMSSQGYTMNRPADLKNILMDRRK
jgi:hypothetical protein